MSTKIKDIKKLKNLPSNLNSVLSEGYRINEVPDWDNISILGSNNIERIIAHLRKSEENLSACIKECYKEKQLFEGKTGKDFKDLANNFENPVGIKTCTNRWSNKTEPCDKESLSRECGASSYNICGWCKHIIGFIDYGYHLEGTCSLLFYQEKVKFNTPCLLHNLTAEDCQNIANKYTNEIEKDKNEREKVRAAIFRLQEEKKKAVKKPYLGELRPDDMYNIMDEVLVYTGGLEGSLITEDWFTAEVIDGYRHYDGFMSYRSDVKTHSGTYLDGHGGSCLVCCFNGLLSWEFEYLRNVLKGNNAADLEFFNIWINNFFDTPKGFNKDSYKKAIESGSIAKNINKQVPQINSVKDAMSLLDLTAEPKTKNEIKNAVQRKLKKLHLNKKTTYAKEITAAIHTARGILLAKLYS